MKRFILCLSLGLAVVRVCAQAPVGSRALSRVEVSRQSWPTFSRLNHGDYNFQFAALQFLLRNQGFLTGTPDGTFDSMRSHPTERAIKSFQQTRGLKVDGAVGAQTWAKLCPRLQRGDRGDAVRALQTLLSVKADGVFGFGTETALRKKQKNFDLKSDGVAGAQTWAALLAPAGD